MTLEREERAVEFTPDVTDTEGERGCVTKRQLKADWSRFERRPSWSAVTSRELAEIFSVSLNSVNNWRMRNLLPEPEPHSRSLPAGNRNWYRISKIRAWLENTSEEEIHWRWARQWLPDYINDIQALSQVEYVVNAAYDLLGVEKPLIPANFTV